MSIKSLLNNAGKILEDITTHFSSSHQPNREQSPDIFSHQDYSHYKITEKIPADSFWNQSAKWAGLSGIAIGLLLIPNKSKATPIPPARLNTVAKKERILEAAIRNNDLVLLMWYFELRFRDTSDSMIGLLQNSLNLTQTAFEVNNQHQISSIIHQLSSLERVDFHLASLFDDNPTKIFAYLENYLQTGSTTSLSEAKKLLRDLSPDQQISIRLDLQILTAYQMKLLADYFSTTKSNPKELLEKIADGNPHRIFDVLEYQKTTLQNRLDALTDQLKRELIVRDLEDALESAIGEGASISEDVIREADRIFDDLKKIQQGDSSPLVDANRIDSISHVFPIILGTDIHPQQIQAIRNLRDYARENLALKRKLTALDRMEEMAKLTSILSGSTPEIAR